MKLLDLFCGAGGAAVGYARAGFTEIVGVDVCPQPRYPFTFVQADALTFPLDGFDVIHASPTCQHHSQTRKILEGKGLTPPGSPDHVPLIRQRLTRAGVPYVIENVPGAPLIDPVVLCGTMFGLQVYRHRLFESNVALPAPPSHQRHRWSTGSHRGYSKDTPFITVSGHNFNRQQGAKAMGIALTTWPLTTAELAQAIPPAYTEFIGRAVLRWSETTVRTVTVGAK